jgi:hypothetical protein
MQSYIYRIGGLRAGVAVAVLWMGQAIAADGEAAALKPVDQYSYRLGGVATFAEMVRVGVKKLALSAPMEPAEMDAFMAGATAVAKSERVMLYREPDLLVTDLFPVEISRGKQVLVIYHDDATLQEYLALKRRRAQLVGSGAYSGAAREQVARQFGRLLSYPDQKIDELLRDRADAQ